MVAAQDSHVAGYIQRSAKGVLVVVNKWDLVAQKDTREYANYVRGELRFLSWAPVLFLSAKSGTGVNQVMPRAFEVYQERLKEVPTDTLTSVIKAAVSAHILPRAGRRELKVLSVRQTGINPPSFEFRVNDRELIHFSYQRYLESKLREAFGFSGTPIRLVFTSQE
jgi:GTP-binding protein